MTDWKIKTEQLTKFLLTRPYMDWVRGDPLTAKEEEIRVVSKEMIKHFQNLLDKLIEEIGEMRKPDDIKYTNIVRDYRRVYNKAILDVIAKLKI